MRHSVGIDMVTRISLSLGCRDVEDEQEWIREKEPLATSNNRGRDLIGVQNLIRKHQGLEAELESRQARVDEVLRAGRAMTQRDHFASPEINDKVTGLSEQSTIAEPNTRTVPEAVAEPSLSQTPGQCQGSQ